MPQPEFRVNVYRPEDLRPSFDDADQIPRPWAVVNVYSFDASCSQPDDMPDTLWCACIDGAKHLQHTAALWMQLDSFHHGLVLVRATVSKQHRDGVPLVNPRRLPPHSGA